MRIDDVSEAVLCGCDTCVQHRTLFLSNTQETEPSNVIGSSVTSVPVSSGPVQALASTSDESAGTAATPLAPLVTTSVIPEPVQSVDSTIFKLPPTVTPVSSEPAQAIAPTISGSMQGHAFGFGAFAAAHRPSLFGASATSADNGSSPNRSVSPAPVQALGTTTTSATCASSISSPVHTCSPTTFQFHPAFTLVAASGPSMFGPMQAPTFGSGATATSSSSSTSSPFDAPSPLRWGPVQASGPYTSTPFSFLPAQGSSKTASAFPPPYSYPGDFARPNVGVSPSGHFGENHFSSPSGLTPKNPFESFWRPGFGVRSPPNPFGPNPQNTTPMSGCTSFFTGVGAEQGSRYPRYAPTPDLDYSGGQGKLIISISASNSHGHKSHEELRWEDYQKGDKGGFGWFPPAHTVSPSLFASPNRPQMRTIRWFPTQKTMTSPYGYTILTAVQSPNERAGVSSPASGCTACGATSSSSPSGHLGLNGTTNAPSSATSLPGLFFSTYGFCPFLFGPPNLAAYVTTAPPAVQAYPMIFGTPNLAGQGTTTTPAVQSYPTMFGTPNLAGQGTISTPAVQPYPMMFGTPNLAAPVVQPYPTMFGTPNLAGQGTTTAPPVQSYPNMFGTPNLAGQGTKTTPEVQAYPMMFGAQNLAAQGTTAAPSVQLYPTMLGTPNLAGQGTITTPTVQPYPMMFGTPNIRAQGITPAAQAYPTHGLTFPFAAMSLQ